MKLHALPRPALVRPDVPPRFCHRLHVPKLTATQSDVFREIAPTALWVAANLDGAQPTRFGDNRGSWPVAMGLTQAWGDFKSAQLRADEPFHERAVVARYWCDAFDHADRLWSATCAQLAGRFDDARGEWMSFEPGTTLAVIDRAVRAAAVVLSVDVLTDREMVEHLEAMIFIASKVQADEQRRSNGA